MQRGIVTAVHRPWLSVQTSHFIPHFYFSLLLRLVFAGLFRLEIAVLLLVREGEDVRELLAIPVDISLANLFLILLLFSVTTAWINFFPRIASAVSFLLVKTMALISLGPKVLFSG